ncbi:fidgetin like 2 [Phyllostomus discolor]|uniref:Fidgetin like 2 n=1 Tax=Phyllostomus discolor TaxID=89673 RepID=A0A834AQD3_9CHIR|nr:fidgetin like 2 [Phyllostomus discolor]
MPSSVEDALDTGTRPAPQPVARAAPGRLLDHTIASPQVGAASWGSPALPLCLGTRRHLCPYCLQPPQALRGEILRGPGLALRAPHPGRLRRRRLPQRRQGGSGALARARATLPLDVTPRRPPGNQVRQWGRLRGPRRLPGFSREPS